MQSLANCLKQVQYSESTHMLTLCAFSGVRPLIMPLFSPAPLGLAISMLVSIVVGLFEKPLLLLLLPLLEEDVVGW